MTAVPSDLVTPEEELRRVSRRLERDMARRDELIVELRSEGLSLARIADLAGLTDVGILKILRRHEDQEATDGL